MDVNRELEDGLGGLINRSDESEVDVKDYLPSGLSYIQFNTDDLLFGLRLFSPIKKTIQDILSRSCLLDIQTDGVIKATMSDGIFRGSVYIPFMFKSEDFPERVVLDFDSIVKVVGFAGKTVCIALDKGSFHVYFHGGRIHLYSFKVDTDRITGKDSFSEGDFVGIESASLLKQIGMAQEFLRVVQIPNMLFMFVKKRGVFLSNGYTVLMMDSDLKIDCCVGRNDLSFIHAASQISGENGMRYLLGESHLNFKSDSVEISLPLISEHFPSAYEKYLEKFDYSSYYKVRFSVLGSILSIMNKMYRSSGTAIIRSLSGTLELETVSMDGNKSGVVLSKEIDGTIKDQEVSFKIDGLLSVIRCIKDYEDINLTMTGNRFCIFSAGVKLAVFGSEAAVKLDMHRTLDALNKG